MEVITTPTDIRAWSMARRREGLTLGLVPTMGCLHRGHATLMDLGRARCDALVVSIFVNPLQFGAGEDLGRYPRTMSRDLDICREAGAATVFAPRALYPDSFDTTVKLDRLTGGLCGASRPGHFDGVATVVARLLGLTRPDLAVFGEKDYQQLLVVRRMVEDLALGVEILAAPVVRDEDGLALSSRNRYLSHEERARACSLHRCLAWMVTYPADDVATLIEGAREILEVDSIDYLEVVDAGTLEPLARVDRPARAMVAARVGQTRLIDNMPMEPR